MTRYQAKAVPNGLELIDALDKGPADISLIGCQMPEMDGLAVTAEIRLREGTTRRTIIIAMTANALEADANGGIAAGMDDYLMMRVRFWRLAHVGIPLAVHFSGSVAQRR